MWFTTESKSLRQIASVKAGDQSAAQPLPANCHEMLRVEAAQTVTDPSEVDEEIRSLSTALFGYTPAPDVTLQEIRVCREVNELIFGQHSRERACENNY